MGRVSQTCQDSVENAVQLKFKLNNMTKYESFEI